jgi:hemerythrin-like metal-binding protein
MIEWDPIYAIGIDTFDLHHQKLIRLLNDAYKSIIDTAEKSAQQKILDDLYAYTDYHFAAEELAMDLRHYRGMVSHIVEHNVFRTKVTELQGKFTGGDDVFCTDMLLFLEEWLINHILKVDKEYATALQGS